MGLRSTRHTLLAAASAIGVVAGLVLVAAESLNLVDVLSYSQVPTYRQVSQALTLSGAAALAGAFGASVLGFLHGIRAQLLALAALLFGAYGAANFAGRLVNILMQTTDQPWKFLAAQAASTAEPFALLVAGLLLAAAVRSKRPGRLLGWVCGALAAHYALAATAYGFDLAGEYDQNFFTPPSRVLAWLGIDGGGYLLCAIAALVATIAFFAGGSQRYRKLGVGAAAFVVGFLTVTAGIIVLATGGAPVASLCLTATFPFVLAVAAGVGAAAFFSLDQRDGADLAVLPDSV